MRDLALRVGITAPDFARHHPSPPPPTRTPHDMSASSSSSTTASLSLPVLISRLRSTVPADKHAALNAAEKDITAAAPEALSTVRARHDCERVLIPFSRLFFVVSHAYFSVVCLSFAVSRRSSSGCRDIAGKEAVQAAILHLLGGRRSGDAATTASDAAAAPSVAVDTPPFTPPISAVHATTRHNNSRPPSQASSSGGLQPLGLLSSCEPHSAAGSCATSGRAPAQPPSESPQPQPLSSGGQVANDLRHAAYCTVEMCPVPNCARLKRGLHKLQQHAQSCTEGDTCKSCRIYAQLRKRTAADRDGGDQHASGGGRGGGGGSASPAAPAAILEHGAPTSMLHTMPPPIVSPATILAEARAATPIQESAEKKSARKALLAHAFSCLKPQCDFPQCNALRRKLHGLVPHASSCTLENCDHCKIWHVYNAYLRKAFGGQPQQQPPQPQPLDLIGHPQPLPQCGACSITAAASSSPARPASAAGSSSSSCEVAGGGGGVSRRLTPQQPACLGASSLTVGASTLTGAALGYGLPPGGNLGLAGLGLSGGGAGLSALSGGVVGGGGCGVHGRLSSIDPLSRPWEANSVASSMQRPVAACGGCARSCSNAPQQSGGVMAAAPAAPPQAAAGVLKSKC